MSLEPQLRGNVLIIAGDAPGERLRRWVESAGEAAVLVRASHARIFERADGPSAEGGVIDLVVTELDTDAPEGRQLLDRLLDGDLLFGVPQLHLLGDPTLRDRLADRNPDIAAMAMGLPGDAADFQARVRLAAEVGRLRRELSHSAIRDEGTGAYNRRFLSMRLEQEIARCRRHGNPLSLVLLEVDRLGAINDRHGVEAGDRVLAHVAEVVLAPRMRREDVFGRWGGNSFAVLLCGSPHPGAAVFAEQVRSAAEAEPLELEGERWPIHLSAGIASAGSGASAAGSLDLLRAAHRALARARDVGGDRVFIDPGVLARPRRLVVIADDDPALVDPAEELLALDDFDVVRAETQEEMLELLDSRRPDLLVIGLHLAVTGDDVALVERVRALFGTEPFPIVGLAPGREERPIPAIGRARVDRYLTKPFSLSVLRSVIRELTTHAGPSPDRRV